MQIIFLAVESGAVELIHSGALVFETDRNPYSDRQTFVRQVLQKAIAFQEIDQSVLIAAQEIETRDRIRGVDALHLAYAEKSVADYFVTCDDRMIRKYSGNVVTITPIELAVLFSTIQSQEP